MKKVFAVACLVATIFICGCGGDKTAEQPAEPKVEQPAPEPEKVDAVAVDGTIWAIDEENVAYLIDALDRNDGEYLKQLSVEQKAFLVDRDTKVTRIGKPAANDTVMIKFKEGRYTNKTGYTRARNIFTEEEYPAYLEAKAAREQAKKDAERQELIDMIYRYLVNTDDCFALIAAGNVAKIQRLNDWIDVEQYKIIELKNSTRIDSDIRECAKKAHKIGLDRGVACILYLKNGHKSDLDYQENEKLRQEFRDKYGF